MPSNIASDAREAASCRHPRGILRISQGSFDTAIVKRNATNRVLEMDLGGFFDSATLAFFKAPTGGCHQLTERHTVIDVAGRPPNAGKIAAMTAEIVFLREMRDLIRKKNIVAISANDPYLSGFNAMLLSAWTRVPYVVEIVSDYDLSYKAAGRRTIPALPSRAAEKWVERLVLGRADAVYADRGYYLKYALGSGAPPARTRRVRCVTDPFYYTATPRAAIDSYHPTNGRPVLFFAGRLSAEKYCLDLVDVLSLVRKRGSDALLFVAGDGPLRSEMIERATSLGVAEDMVLLGNRNAQELVDLMSGARVLLATHAGYALIELGLSATPIVAYDYEWHPELVRDGETGMLVPYRDAHAMADAAFRLIQNPALGKAIGAQAREFCLREHASADAREDERKIFEEIFQRRSRL